MSRKLNYRFFFDIDEVVRDFTGNCIANFGEKFDWGNKIEPISNWNQYEMSQFFHVPQEMFIKEVFVEHPDIYLGEAWELDMNLSTANSICKSLYGVTYITSQPNAKCAAVTVDWLARHFAQFDSLIFCKEKWLHVENSPLCVFVDDNPEHLEQMMRRRPKVKTFVLDKPWNKEVKCQRIKTLKDLGPLLSISW